MKRGAANLAQSGHSFLCLLCSLLDRFMYSQPKPLGLDLYSGAGGASAGYVRAGFRMVGVDKYPMRHYPYEFIQCDALKALDILLAGRSLFGYRLRDFAFIHASCPCQGYSVTTKALRNRGRKYPDLIGPTRERLIATGLPYVIENVPGSPLHNPVMLCGTMFDLHAGEYELQRHRLFETGLFGFGAPVPCNHRGPVVCVFGGHARDRRKRSDDSLGIAAGKGPMCVDWMNGHELSESIPPVYTECVGKCIMAILRTRHVLAA